MVLHFHFTFKPFPSHAQKRERARERKSLDVQRERERRERRERREIANPETDSNSDSDEPRNQLQLRRTHLIALRRIKKTHSIAPKKPIQSNLENQFVKPRKPIWSHHLRPSSRRSHLRRDRRTPAPIHPKPIVLVAPQNRSFSCYFCWVLRIWVLFLLGFDEFGFFPRPNFVVLNPDSSSPFIEPSRLSLSLSIWPNLMKFFCWDLFLLCLFIEKWY